MSCDCLIGEFNNEKLYLSDYVDILEEASRFSGINFHEYLDGRKGYTTKFYYCPWCGKEIDWKKIKKDLE